MAYAILHAGELEWVPRDDASGREVVRLSESLTQSRANLWRYPAGARGKRHVGAAREPAACRASERVVRLPLLRVGKEVVRGLDVLEPFLGRRVVRVPIRVVLGGELPVRLLDLVLGRGLLDTEHLVGINGHW